MNKSNKIEAIISKVLDTRCYISLYLESDGYSTSVSLGSDESFELTFAQLDELATALQTKQINLSHERGCRYSSYTYDPASTTLSIKGIPKALVDED